MPEYGSSHTLAGDAARDCSAALLTTGWAITAVVAALTLAPATTRALDALITILLPTVFYSH